MKVHDCEQYSDEWWNLRLGLPTSSQFNRIITPKKGDYSAAAKPYISELVAERFLRSSGGTDYQSAAMVRGGEVEPQARTYYELLRGVTARQVGICIEDGERYGASPDSLVGEDGVLEIKCPEAKRHVEYLVAGGLPDEYRAQVAGHLLVTGRAWCDFMSYHPDLPPLVVRMKPNAFVGKLEQALARFCGELD